MLAVRLSNDTENRLEHLASETGRSKSFYVRAAVEKFLEDNEDYYIALSRLEKNNPKLSLAEMEKRLGLED